MLRFFTAIALVSFGIYGLGSDLNHMLSMTSLFLGLFIFFVTRGKKSSGKSGDTSVVGVTTVISDSSHSTSSSNCSSSDSGGGDSGC